MVADLVEGFCRAFRRDRITDARASHSISLRERARADDVRHVDQRLDRRRRACRCRFAIGLVEHQQRRFRQGLCKGHDLVGLPPASHWIVRIGEIDERRIFPAHGIEQPVQVLAVVHVRRGHQPAAKTGDVEIEGRVAAEGIHHRHRRCRCRVYDEPHDLAEKAVDPFADRQIFRLAVEMGSECCLEVEIFRIRIFPDARRGFRHGCNYGWRRAEAVFIGADARLDDRTALSLQRFRADKRHGRGQ
ncbi:hypothetical protein D3C80_650910 [compost metagenome]